MANGHTLRIRDPQWNEIKKHAWKLSTKANEMIQPTDVAAAVLLKHTKEITEEDVKKSMKKIKEMK